MTAQAPLTFSAAIGSPLWRAGLAREVARETAFALDFIEISPIFRAFAPMVREQRFDVSEMAIATALQDIAYGSKLMVLPVTLVSRFQHQCLITRNTPAPLRPADLAGRRVGVRAYSQTTGVWVRGILENDFGVPASSITWVTQEGAHLAQYENPAWVIQQDDPRSLVDMLRDGEIDAAILGNDLPEDASLTTVIANPQAAAQDWYARHRVIPTNHVMVVRQDLADAHPAPSGAASGAPSRSQVAGSTSPPSASKPIARRWKCCCNSAPSRPCCRAASRSMTSTPRPANCWGRTRCNHRANAAARHLGAGRGIWRPVQAFFSSTSFATRRRPSR